MPLRTAAVFTRLEMWRQQHNLLRRLSPVKMAAQQLRQQGHTVRLGRPTTAPHRRGGRERRRLCRRGAWWTGSGCVPEVVMAASAKGAPDPTAKAGGNGGTGGDVILECARSIWDFSNLQHHTKASRGGNGLSKNQIGTRGSDKVAQVPVGRVIHVDLELHADEPYHVTM